MKKIMLLCLVFILGFCSVGCETFRKALGLEEKFEPGESTAEQLLSNVSVSPETFNPDKGEFAKFSYSLNAQAATITLTITDSKLYKVKELVAMKDCAPGAYQIVWDGKNDEGKVVKEGIYNWYLIAETESAKVLMEISGRQVVSGKITIQRGV